MRIISCASYYGSGSSAITDLLSEYSCCTSLSDYEFRFVQDPEGISDLEYNLVENHHRHNSGHALKRYKKKVDFLSGNKIIKKYEQFFNNRWKQYSYEYIDELTEFRYKGYWHQDVIDKGKLFYFRKRLVNKVLQKTIWRGKEQGLLELPNEITLGAAPSEEKFLKCTKKYIDKLFEEANYANRPNIIVDQIVPPSNLKRYLRYFNNIQVFVVDRDPRDIYLLEKYIWKGTVVPVDSVEVFCKWYRYTRQHRETEVYENTKVKFIQFEDLVYEYDKTINEIEDWLRIDKKYHVEMFKYFDPKKSINNTRLWNKIEVSTEDLKYIEENLSEYIYKYEGREQSLI